MKMVKAGEKLIDKQELLKWQGVVILVAMADYHGDRRDLWGGGGSYSEYVCRRITLKRLG